VPRPRVYDQPRVATAVRLPKQLHERIQREADERQVSVNYIVERAIERYLDRMVPVAELQLERDERTNRNGNV
jgi:predicted transcriptional regulator